MKNIFKNNLIEHSEVLAKLATLSPMVDTSANIIVKCLEQDGCVFFCGNGGSAADSQHLAAEFTGRFVRERSPMAGIALTTDTSALTAIANDYGFDEIFSRQLAALAKPNDCLVAISTSGNSTNIKCAINKAKELGVTTIGLLGCDGGVLKDLCDTSLVVPSNITARIQEMHILIGHSWCESVDTLNHN